MDALAAYVWPGNVRELRNVVERLVILAPGASITTADLPERLSVGDVEGFVPPAESSLQAARREFERRLISERLEETGGEHHARRRVARHRAEQSVPEDARVRDTARPGERGES